MPVLTSDVAWVRQAFMLPKHTLAAQSAKRRLFSNAAFKFTDTTLGGNFAINPPPQFTRYADLKVRGRFSKSKGMGRYYSEALDDNAQHIHMRFGVPEYNSLTNFFTNFYDHEAATLVRTGRAPGIFYSLGKAAGFVVSLPLQVAIVGGSAYRFFMSKPASKYYYLKPTMPLYWNAVNTIANGIAVNMGIVPRVMSDESNAIMGVAKDHTYNAADIERFHRVLPDVFRKKGGVDIYAVATRAQRLADQHHREISEFMSSYDTTADLIGKMQELEREAEAGRGGLSMPKSRGIEAYLQTYAESIYGTVTEGEGKESVENRSRMDLMFDSFLAEWRDGAAFTTFRVNHTGTASESFSNSTRDSEISSKFNGMASSARNARFSVAEGNISDGVLGSMVGAVGGAVKDFVMGALDSVGIAGLGALAGNAFVDIPKHWDGSTANLPRMEYTLELRSPFGNKMSRFMNLWIPVSMLLAGALPRSTGTQSYNSPFLVELYSKGRAQTRLGIIDSMTITRGVGNLGWTPDGEALGVDVTFSVIDLSSVMHMPIVSALRGADLAGAAAATVGAGLVATGGGAVVGTALAAGGAALVAKSLFDDDNTYTDYLAVIGSLGLVDQIYPLRRLKLNLTRKLTAFDSWLSPTHFANWSMGTFPSQVISAFSRITDRGG